MSDRFSDDVLDRAIDDVARELTAAPPRHGFAARVRARIDRRRPTRPWVSRVAAAAAVLTIAVYVFRPAPPADAPAVVVTGPVESRRPRVGSPVASPPPPTAAADRTRGRGVTRTLPTGTERIAVEEDAVQLAALSDVEPLSLAIEAPAELAVASIGFDELSISPLNPESEKEPR